MYEISANFGQDYQYNIEDIVNDLNYKLNKNLNNQQSEYNSSLSSTSHYNF